MTRVPKAAIARVGARAAARGPAVGQDLSARFQPRAVNPASALPERPVLDPLSAQFLSVDSAFVAAAGRMADRNLARVMDLFAPLQ